MFKNEVIDRNMDCIMQDLKKNAQVCRYSLSNLNINHCGRVCTGNPLPMKKVKAGKDPAKCTHNKHYTPKNKTKRRKVIKKCKLNT